MRIRILFTPLLVAALGLPVAASAQSQSESPATAAQRQFSEQQLSQFADAYKAIQGIRQDYTQRLQSAANREQAIKLQQQANKEMLQAVRDTGLSIDEYRAIAQAASNDPELARRLQGML